MIRRPPRSTLDRSSAASDVYKRQVVRRRSYPDRARGWIGTGRTPTSDKWRSGGQGTRGPAWAQLPGIRPNGHARHVAQDERTLRSLRVLQPRAALHPRLEEQPDPTERARLRRCRSLCRTTTTVSRRDRRAKFDYPLSRRWTWNRPCP